MSAALSRFTFHWLDRDKATTDGTIAFQCTSCAFRVVIAAGPSYYIVTKGNPYAYHGMVEYGENGAYKIKSFAPAVKSDPTAEEPVHPPIIADSDNRTYRYVDHIWRNAVDLDDAIRMIGRWLERKEQRPPPVPVKTEPDSNPVVLVVGSSDVALRHYAMAYPAKRGIARLVNRTWHLRGYQLKDIEDIALHYSYHDIEADEPAFYEDLCLLIMNWSRLTKRQAVVI
jgi:hypothetical protein